MGRLSRFLVPVLALAAGFGVVSLHMGCSGSSRPTEATTVRGRVTFQGQPVAGATVVFAPDRERARVANRFGVNALPMASLN